MSAIESAKKHFDSLGIKKIEVPEWELTIYAKPLTLAEMSKLQRFAKDSDVELMAHCVMMKSLNEEGEKIFGLDDKHDLMNHVDKDILSRVAADIMSDDPEEDQAKK
jgi:hypothetical protein|tara:strand:+ start:1655 stop:1975 length:321 start_codon:yes stop_codon:yes gene_type:complete